MTSRDFCYWLQGYFEIGDDKTMSGDQVDMVKRHLAMVFEHEIDPSMGGAVKQSALDALHKVGPNQTDPFASVTIGGEVQTPNGPVRYRC